MRYHEGGPRHFLGGLLVEIGAHLWLQSVEWPDGETLSALREGQRVSYEAILQPGAVIASLRLELGGHSFYAAHEPWMRFRWVQS
jgi:hypothetical protein